MSYIPLPAFVSWITLREAAKAPGTRSSSAGGCPVEEEKYNPESGMMSEDGRRHGGLDWGQLWCLGPEGL